MSAALKVVAPGLHTTVQDRGRFGYQALGVPVSGALDAESFEIANRLAGNGADLPALEILHLGPTLQVEADNVRVAIAGGSAEIELQGERPISVGGWRSALLRRGQIFRVHRLGTSVCCYLAVEGGFALEPVLGSASTYVRGGFGGLAGRALAAGDALPLARENATERGELALAFPRESGSSLPIRIVLGPQRDHFTEAAVETLLAAEFTVSKDADRMGLRLEGPKLEHRGGWDIVSDGIATGAIQVPGSGQAILLLADHQTTGGYPKIATVISADLPVVGRRKPGDRIRFAAVEVAEAERMGREARAALAAAIASMAPPRPQGGLDLDRLNEANLISGVVFDQL
ncbi:MAG TPA: biotin-dependent carboxyltransferase family protein [Stellaceae bacterium]|nr:biotin-dependent carboxyltransferase family protein [Stellaceae bacterium]